MFTPDEIPRIVERITVRISEDQRLLNGLRDDVRSMRSESHVIRPRSATAVSMVASDGGNNQIAFDPFFLQLVRVVDSYGKQLCFDLISQTTDTGLISQEQFGKDGKPTTALGRMMRDLGVDPPELSELSYMIPSSDEIKKNPEKISTQWVQVYRDLCEWAVLYDLICNNQFATDTLIIRDGTLRSPFFRGDYFIRWRKLVEESIDKIYKNDRRNVFLAGLYKTSKVYQKYQLALSLEEVLQCGDPRYVRVHRALEEKTFKHIQHSIGPEVEGIRKQAAMRVAGDMFFVRFGPRSGDPVWCVDILSKQSEHADKIFGYMLSDAINGFPVPFYPRCLQMAHEHAQIIGFDEDILQEEIINAIRKSIPEEKRLALDELRFHSDMAKRRYT